jgi:hypothetical protein
MKIGIRLLSIVGVLGAFAGVTAFGAPIGSANPDLVVRTALHVPGAGDFDVYDYAAGIEAQYRFWGEAPWGWSLAAGLTQWESGGGSTDWAGDVGGSALAFPLGASGLVAFPTAPGQRVTLEAGLRVIFVESDLKLETSTGRRDVDVATGLLAVVAAEWEAELAEDLSLALGAGYQFDLLQAEAETDEADLQDNQWQSFFFRAGVVFRF